MCTLRPPAQAEYAADDIDIVFDKMSLWSKEEAEKFFESGGVDEPSAAVAAPPKAALLPTPDDADIKKWFPKWTKHDNPRFRIVCFHNAGSAESTYTGKGLRQKDDNPFVAHCKANGGELLACELPGRETRRNEPRERVLRPCCEALYPVPAPLLLAPLLRAESVPYVHASHSLCISHVYRRCSRRSCRSRACRTSSSATRWALG